MHNAHAMSGHAYVHSEAATMANIILRARAAADQLHHIFIKAMYTSVVYSYSHYHSHCDYISDYIITVIIYLHSKHAFERVTLDLKSYDIRSDEC